MHRFFKHCLQLCICLNKSAKNDTRVQNRHSYVLLVLATETRWQSHLSKSFRGWLRLQAGHLLLLLRRQGGGIEWQHLRERRDKMTSIETNPQPVVQQDTRYTSGKHFVSYFLFFCLQLSAHFCWPQDLLTLWHKTHSPVSVHTVRFVDQHVFQRQIYLLFLLLQLLYGSITLKCEGSQIAPVQ